MKSARPDWNSSESAPGAALGGTPALPGEDLPLQRTGIPGPQSLALARRLRAVESPDTTFISPEFPIFWNSALGSNVVDVDGNRYIDLDAGFGVASIGHCHPEVVRAIQMQSERLLHGMGDVHPSELKVELAEQVIRHAPPGFEWKVVFGSSGSDAVEAAIKTAAIATGRPGVIAFEGAYHGLTLGALRGTNGARFREGLDEIIPRPAILFPYPKSTSLPSENSAEEILTKLEDYLDSSNGKASRVGATLVEPILGRGGVIIPPPEFLPRLRNICDHHNLLLIFDEVFTGFGRTGDWFACNHEGVVPDLIAAGKSLGGGMPISVCIGRTEVIDQWGRSNGEARHTQTFLGHPLACASALATLRVLEGENLIEVSRSKGRHFLDLLTAALSDNPRIASVRGRGMMIGIEIVDPSTRAPDGAGTWRAVIACLRRGLIVLPSGAHGNVFCITPPFMITEEQLQVSVSAIADALA